MTFKKVSDETIPQFFSSVAWVKKGSQHLFAVFFHPYVVAKSSDQQDQFQELQKIRWKRSDDLDFWAEQLPTAVLAVMKQNAATERRLGVDMCWSFHVAIKARNKEINYCSHVRSLETQQLSLALSVPLLCFGSALLNVLYVWSMAWVVLVSSWHRCHVQEWWQLAKAKRKRTLDIYLYLLCSSMLDNTHGHVPKNCRCFTLIQSDSIQFINSYQFSPTFLSCWEASTNQKSHLAAPWPAFNAPWSCAPLRHPKDWDRSVIQITSVSARRQRVMGEAV